MGYVLTPPHFLQCIECFVFRNELRKSGSIREAKIWAVMLVSCSLDPMQRSQVHS
jgi:hypothetical protein